MRFAIVIIDIAGNKTVVKTTNKNQTGDAYESNKQCLFE